MNEVLAGIQPAPPEQKESKVKSRVDILRNYLLDGNLFKLRSHFNKEVDTRSKGWLLVEKGLSVLKNVLYEEFQTEALISTLEAAGIELDDVPVIKMFAARRGAVPAPEPPAPEPPAPVMPDGDPEDDPDFLQKTTEQAKAILSKSTDWVSDKGGRVVGIGGRIFTKTIDELKGLLRRGGRAFRVGRNNVKVGAFSIQDRTKDQVRDSRTATKERLLKIASKRIVIELMVVGIILVQGEFIKLGTDVSEGYLDSLIPEEDKSRLSIEGKYGEFYTGHFGNSETDLFRAQGFNQDKEELAARPNWIAEHIGRMSRFEQRDVALIKLAEILDETFGIEYNDQNKFVSYFTSFKGYSAEEAEWLWRVYQKTKKALDGENLNFDHINDDINQYYRSGGSLRGERVVASRRDPYRSQKYGHAAEVRSQKTRARV